MGDVFGKFLWQDSSKVLSHKYTCAYCNSEVASVFGKYATHETDGRIKRFVIVCPNCSSATYFDETGVQYPAPVFGEPIRNVDDESVLALYEEARRAYSVNSYTAVALCCRVLLMHVAVDLGATGDPTFQQCIDFLKENRHITARADKWVVTIKDYGNIANHDIKLINKEQAEVLLKFTEMFLKTNYEYPAIAGKLPKP
jgi:transcription elongation factor Elf1